MGINMNREALEMGAVVYYFTGTGNSLVVAKDIAKEINGELISIPSVISNDTVKTDADVIGIVFPVYMWGMPLIIERFVKKIENVKNKYVFAIATYGGMPGATINMLEKVIKSYNGELAAGFTVHMPSNYIPMVEAIDDKKQQQLFNEMDKKVETIAEHIKSRRIVKKENSNVFLRLIFSGIINRASSPHIPKMDKQFRVDEKCNSCGICQKICPVNNIDIIDRKPSWKGNCDQCFACLQWCPEKAIQCGKNTVARKRYHHPDVTIADIIKHAEGK
jgi:flavodoxin/Pyruvate/2-oxoacid:ferredoxin oxidoreductase delta subunit